MCFVLCTMLCALHNVRCQFGVSSSSFRSAAHTTRRSLASADPGFVTRTLCVHCAHTRTHLHTTNIHTWTMARAVPTHTACQHTRALTGDDCGPCAGNQSPPRARRALHTSQCDSMHSRPLGSANLRDQALHKKCDPNAAELFPYLANQQGGSKGPERHTELAPTPGHVRVRVSFVCGCAHAHAPAAPISPDSRLREGQGGQAWG